MSYYIHQIPGRLRVKTPLIKRNQETGQEIQELLRPIKGISSVETNSTTGSIVIHYSCNLVSSERILEILKGAGYFDQSKAVTNDQYIHAKASKTGHLIWGALSGAFLEAALGSSPLSLITLLI
ncbi:MAG: HMA2 domain-containing protein [Nitrospiria bacterium]